MKERHGSAGATMSERILTARWLAPITSGLIREGALVFSDDQILAVDVLPRFPRATIENLGESILLPALINPHTHLELSDCRCGAPPTEGFAGWLVNMLRRTRITPEEMNQAVTGAIAAGVDQCLKFGVATVGDISRQCHLTRPLLQKTPLRVVSYGEIQAMAQRRGMLEERIEIAVDDSYATERMSIGITPHAPYSIEPAGYRRCLQIAREKKLPLATHLAETADEAPFLADHTGPLRDLWDAWLTWDDFVPRFAAGPIRFARSLGLLDYPTLLAHVNYCDDEELKILAAGAASVVYCPRTHAYFQHPTHRWRDMISAGINVAVGTDSCASSPDLNPVDDLRLLHQLFPQVETQLLWELITIRAAAALGLKDSIGSLEVGKQADVVAFPTSTGDPLRELLNSTALPGNLWIAGAPVGNSVIRH
jgi:aminodeoxyfutalosine deaminase